METELFPWILGVFRPLLSLLDRLLGRLPRRPRLDAKERKPLDDGEALGSAPLLSDRDDVDTSWELTVIDVFPSSDVVLYLSPSVVSVLLEEFLNNPPDTGLATVADTAAVLVEEEPRAGAWRDE